MQIVAQLLAIAGPVFLAIMGVAVTVWPPSKPEHHLVWGISFILVGVLAIAGSIKQQNDAAKASAAQIEAINGLKKAVENLAVFHFAFPRPKSMM